MKASQTPLFTLMDDPRDAHVASHRLLVRAGFIRKQSSGLYSYLPFGYAVHLKIEQIIREEMNRYGGVEVHLPVITEAELWEASGRWSAMGPEMMRLNDRHENRYALGPTHEEAITQLAGTYLQSYKQLPLNLYQIGTKYRDEIRPRYGLIRCREFVMKDAYSFHTGEDSLEETYQKMRTAYRAIFDRCGLKTIAVEADSGAMGGSGSEEFMVASEIGEETLLLCNDEKDCRYRSNVEKTEYIYSGGTGTDDAAAADVETPGAVTVEEVATLLNKKPEDFIKTVIFEDAEKIVIGFIPGDRNLNEAKFNNTAGLNDAFMAAPETVRAVTGASPGFAGPAELPVKNGDQITTGESTRPVIILADRSLKGRKGLVSGANRDDMHRVNLVEGRDFKADDDTDIVEARSGDLCPRCRRETLHETRGIEVGHIFKLGRKYTEALKVEVLGVDGKPVTPEMGCYGIGVGRTLATVVEQNHDENGIIWPVNLAPYHFYLIGIAKKDAEKEKVNNLYTAMIEKNLSVFYDDRPERPGVKFKDADLTGLPWQLVAGKTFFTENRLEMKNRHSGEKTLISPEELLSGSFDISAV